MPFSVCFRCFIALEEVLDVESAEASVDNDLRMIQNEIAKYEGTGPWEGYKGADALNRLLRSLVATQVALRVPL